MYCNMPFIDYLNLVDDVMTTMYGITSNDTNMDHIAECQECDETPEECVRQLGDKYDLDII